MKRDAFLILLLGFGMVAVVLLSRSIDSRRSAAATNFSEQQLYVSGPTAKRMTMAFNGLAADWYWMRTLQYVGRKIVGHQDTHEGQFDLNDLSKLDLRLLPSLLQVTTTLDPQFIAAYEYGAVILPDVSPDDAVALLNHGIASNPDSWRLHQHLGYIHWQRKNYEKASEVYANGSKLPGAPAWMAAMAARMNAERGSRATAREMYRRLYEASQDDAIKEMVTGHLMRLDWLDDRDLIRPMLNEYRARSGRCPASWREIAVNFTGTRLRIDLATGAPLDPSGLPYRLINDGCDIDLAVNSKVLR